MPYGKIRLIPRLKMISLLNFKTPEILKRHCYLDIFYILRLIPTKYYSSTIIVITALETLLCI